MNRRIVIGQITITFFSGIESVSILSSQRNEVARVIASNIKRLDGTVRIESPLENSVFRMELDTLNRVLVGFNDSKILESIGSFNVSSIS